LFRTASITKRELTFTSAIELAFTKDEKRSLKKLFRLSDRSQALVNNLHAFVKSDEVHTLFIKKESTTKKNRRRLKERPVTRLTVFSFNSDSSSSMQSSSFSSSFNDDASESDSFFSDTNESESNNEEIVVTEENENDDSLSSESDSLNDDLNTRFNNKLRVHRLNKA